MSKQTSNDIRTLISNHREPTVSADFVARTVAAARELDQLPAETRVVRGPWLKIASLAAAAAVIFAMAVGLDKPTGTTAVASTDLEFDPVVLVATTDSADELEYVQLMLALDSEDFEGDDLLAFAL